MGGQWLERKRAYKGIRLLFERESIKFAYRALMVLLTDGKLGAWRDEHLEAALSAARASIEEDMFEGSDEVGDDS